MPSHKSGFTLIEILVASALFLIIIGAITAVLRVAEMSWNSGMGSVHAQQQARQAMDGMLKEIRQSKSMDLNVTAPGDIITFNVPIDITTSPITYSADITYYLNNTANQIIRENPPGTNSKVLANNVTQLNFCCQGGTLTGDCYDCANADFVRIQVGINETVRQQVFRFNLTEQGRFRNE